MYQHSVSDNSKIYKLFDLGGSKFWVQLCVYVRTRLRHKLIVFLPDLAITLESTYFNYSGKRLMSTRSSLKLSLFAYVYSESAPLCLRGLRFQNLKTPLVYLVGLCRISVSPGKGESPRHSGAAVCPLPRRRLPRQA